MDYINLKIFKNGDDITFLLHNAINHKEIIAMVTEMMTGEYASVNKRCFQCDNDIIIELYGLAKNVDAVLSDIIKKTMNCGIQSEPVTGLTIPKVTEQNECPDTSTLEEFVPPLLTDNVGAEEFDTPGDTQVDVPAVQSDVIKQIRLAKYPELNRIPSLTRAQMAKILDELYPIYELELDGLLKERKRKSIRDFIRFEKEQYLRVACYQIAEKLRSM